MTNVNLIFEVVKETKESFWSKDVIPNLIALFNFFAVMYIFFNEKKAENMKNRFHENHFGLEILLLIGI